MICAYIEACNIGERNMHRSFFVVVVVVCLFVCLFLFFFCFGVASFLVLVCILQVTGRIFICM